MCAGHIVSLDYHLASSNGGAYGQGERGGGGMSLWALGHTPILAAKVPWLVGEAELTGTS